MVPPVLLEVAPNDSLLNVRPQKIILYFDEYVTAGDAQKEVTISPILPVPLVVMAVKKHILVRLPDTLLEDNTTYHISFGKAIKDVHEGNAFTGYTYTFSTGGYFDSLTLAGKVTNAGTGMPDSAGTLVMLYSADESDSAVVKKKPRYVTRVKPSGDFVFKGLPGRKYRIYALKDENNNMIFDGGTEMIAFIDSFFVPADTVVPGLELRIFQEKVDTTLHTQEKAPAKKGLKGKPRMSAEDTTLSYELNVDTSDATRRTFNLKDSVKIVFNKIPGLHPGALKLTMDSSGHNVNIPVALSRSVQDSMVCFIKAPFKPNSVYDLVIDTAFASDTAGRHFPPAHYRFRTLRADDYGQLTLNVPARYAAGISHETCLLVMKADKETVYTGPITDSVIKFKWLKPATYTFCIIVDRNGNGEWDTGDMLRHVQPEFTIPSVESVPLKANWETVADFEQQEKPVLKKKK